MLTVITNNLGGDLRGEVLLSYTAKHLNQTPPRCILFRYTIEYHLLLLMEVVVSMKTINELN